MTDDLEQAKHEVKPAESSDGAEEEEMSYEAASKYFMDVSRPPYVSPSAKLAELMMKLPEEDKTDKDVLGAKLTDLIHKISPGVPR